MKKIKIKPGKMQSTAGFVVGLLMSMIGLFFVVPTFGAFGLIWTLVAFIITGLNGYNAFSKHGAATHEIIIDESEYTVVEPETVQPDETSSHHASRDDDIKARLIKLRDLYDNRLISEEEYQAKRKEIFDEI